MVTNTQWKVLQVVNDMYENKVKWCPICNQGWVEIVKDISTETLFCCCAECESEWNTPFNIEKSTCNLENKFGFIEDPTYDEIEKMGWDKYILRAQQLSLSL